MIASLPAFFYFSFAHLLHGNEFLGMDVQRVGVATNPTPYALFCAFMVLDSFHQLLMQGVGEAFAFDARYWLCACYPLGGYI